MHSLKVMAAVLGIMSFVLASPFLQLSDSVSIDTGRTWQPPNLPQTKPGKYWHGWKGVQKFFAL